MLICSSQPEAVYVLTTAEQWLARGDRLVADHPGRRLVVRLAEWIGRLEWFADADIEPGKMYLTSTLAQAYLARRWPGVSFELLPEATVLPEGEEVLRDPIVPSPDPPGWEAARAAAREADAIVERIFRGDDPPCVRCLGTGIDPDEPWSPSAGARLKCRMCKGASAEILAARQADAPVVVTGQIE